MVTREEIKQFNILKRLKNGLCAYIRTARKKYSVHRLDQIIVAVVGRHMIILFFRTKIWHSKILQKYLKNKNILLCQFLICSMIQSKKPQNLAKNFFKHLVRMSFWILSILYFINSINQPKLSTNNSKLTKRKLCPAFHPKTRRQLVSFSRNDISSAHAFYRRHKSSRYRNTSTCSPPIPPFLL